MKFLDRLDNAVRTFVRSELERILESDRFLTTVTQTIRTEISEWREDVLDDVRQDVRNHVDEFLADALEEIRDETVTSEPIPEKITASGDPQTVDMQPQTSAEDATFVLDLNCESASECLELLKGLEVVVQKREEALDCLASRTPVENLTERFDLTKTQAEYIDQVGVDLEKVGESDVWAAIEVVEQDVDAGTQDFVGEPTVEDLSKKAVRVMGAIQHVMLENGNNHWTYENIYKALGAHRPHLVTDSVRELQEKGYIKRERHGQRYETTLLKKLMEA